MPLSERASKKQPSFNITLHNALPSFLNKVKSQRKRRMPGFQSATDLHPQLYLSSTLWYYRECLAQALQCFSFLATPTLKPKLRILLQNLVLKKLKENKQFQMQHQQLEMAYTQQKQGHCLIA